MQDVQSSASTGYGHSDESIDEVFLYDIHEVNTSNGPSNVKYLVILRQALLKGQIGRVLPFIIFVTRKQLRCDVLWQTIN